VLELLINQSFKAFKIEIFINLQQLIPKKETPYEI
jgi:hypothetical protein